MMRWFLIDGIFFTIIGQTLIASTKVSLEPVACLTVNLHCLGSRYLLCLLFDGLN